MYRSSSKNAVAYALVVAAAASVLYAPMADARELNAHPRRLQTSRSVGVGGSGFDRPPQPYGYAPAPVGASVVGSDIRGGYAGYPGVYDDDFSYGCHLRSIIVNGSPVFQRLCN